MLKNKGFKLASVGPEGFPESAALAPPGLDTRGDVSPSKAECERDQLVGHGLVRSPKSPRPLPSHGSKSPLSPCCKDVASRNRRKDVAGNTC